MDLVAYLNAVLTQVAGISKFYEFRVLMQREDRDSVTASREVTVARTNSSG